MRRVVPAIAIALLLASCSVLRPAAPIVHDEKQTKAFSTYLSARFAASEHDFDQASRYYSESLKDDPANTSLQSLSFFYAASAGDMSEAEKYASNVVLASPGDRAARLALSVAAFKRGDYAEVRKQLSLSAKGPFSVLIISLFDGWAAAAQHDKATMDQDLATLAAEKGAESVAAFHKALMSDLMGDAATAGTGYNLALKDGATPRVVDAYGRFLERAGRLDAAAALYRIQPPGNTFAAITGPGLKRVAEEEKSKSRPDAMVRTAADGAAESLFGIAASLNDAASAEVSVLYLRMALYLRPDFPLARILIANRFERLQKFDDAITAYRAIMPDSPYYHMAQVQIALDETQRNQPDRAIADFRKLVTDDPTDVESWTALGDALRAQNHNAEAVDAYDHAEKALGTPQEKDWPLFYARATAKERVNDLAGAQSDVQAGLKLSPEQPELLNYLGYSWVDRGERIPEALAMLEKARGLRPYDGYIVDSVGWAYFRLGRYDDAASALEEAVLLVPGDPTINEHLGDALWRAGKHIDARFQWNHALTFSDNATDKTEIEQKIKIGLAG